MIRKLYWAPGSPFSFRVIIALKEKNLEFESFKYNIAKGEHKTLEVIALNPRGELPILVDGEIILCQSAAIISYLDEAYPNPPFMPKDLVSRTKVYQIFYEIEDLLLNSKKIIIGKLRRGDKYTQEEFNTDLLNLKCDLKYVNDRLSNNKFAAGDFFSKADISLSVLLFSLGIFGATYDEYPNLKAYAKRLKDRDSIKASWSPSQKDSKKLFIFFKGKL